MSTYKDDLKNSNGGGSMAIKQALFLGGAVLVLAACSSDVTGPGTQMKKAGTRAMQFLPDSTSEPTTMSDGCHGYVIVSGHSDSSCAVQEQ